VKRLLAVSWEMPPMYGPRATQVSRVLGQLAGMGWRPAAVCLAPRPGGPHWFKGIASDAPAGVELVNKDQAWFDPFLGARFTIPNTGKWTFMFRGDVGGFGVGSQFAWQVRPTIAYSVSKHWTFGVAYWALGMDYVSGERGDRDYFKYDVTTFGPEIGVGYTF